MLYGDMSLERLKDKSQNTKNRAYMKSVSEKIAEGESCKLVIAVFSP